MPPPPEKRCPHQRCRCGPERLRYRQALPARYRDRALGGGWQGFRDGPIEPDLVLIDRQTGQALALARMGSQAEWLG